MYCQHRSWLDMGRTICVYSLNVRYEGGREWTGRIGGRWMGGGSCSVLFIRNRSVTHDTSRTYACLVHSRSRSTPYGRIPRSLALSIALHSTNFYLSPFLAVLFRSRLPFKRRIPRDAGRGAGRRIRVQPFHFDAALGTAGVKTCLCIATTIQRRTYKAAA